MGNSSSIAAAAAKEEKESGEAKKKVRSVLGVGEVEGQEVGPLLSASGGKALVVRPRFMWRPYL